MPRDPNTPTRRQRRDARIKHQSERTTVVHGFLGTTLDRGRRAKRWDKWRPSLGVVQQPDIRVDRFELFYPPSQLHLAEYVRDDIGLVSPHTTVVLHPIHIENPWDFEQVYDALWQYASTYTFNTDDEDHLVHITTGTHVAQICLFLLTESHELPGKLLQTSPPRRSGGDPAGTASVIDLNLARYDKLASRIAARTEDDVSFLKAGIDTQNAQFNTLIAQIERVAGVSDAPLLLTGPTGAGKTKLARRIYDLKQRRGRVQGAFIDVNCATLRGDGAMSTLFGHVKGAFTGALKDRPGVLRAADGGLLFLDEIGELGLDEQAMLLRALESGRFMPLGADKEVSSAFVLLAGTNRDLTKEVAAGRFREDLLARINLWTFELPGLAQRAEDIAPNLVYELARFADSHGSRVRMTGRAETRFLRFATAPDTPWRGNFRDLGAAVERMATLSDEGRIDEHHVDDEIARLRRSWRRPGDASVAGPADAFLTRVCARKGIDVDTLDRFDRVQLADVLSVCQKSKTLSQAGRALFAASRAKKKSSNDSDRLRKYLAKFGLAFADVHADPAPDA